MLPTSMMKKSVRKRWNSRMTRQKPNIRDGSSRIDGHERMQDSERTADLGRENAMLVRDSMDQDRMCQ